MKIYASKHDIRESQNVGLKEIPLAFIDTEDTEFDVDVKISQDFGNDKSDRVMPYNEFSDDNPHLFKKDGSLVTNTQFKRVNDRYIYEPHSMNEYSLKDATSQFGVQVLIKRAMSYKNSTRYNLKIGVAEETGGLDFSKKLISIFGDANRRGKCPANISVNSGNTIPQSLITNKLEENDFLIAHSPDGEHIIKNSNLAKLDIDSLMDMHTNVWISADKFGDMMEKDSVNAVNGKLIGSQLYDRSEYTVDPKNEYVFAMQKTHPAYPEEKYRYTRLHPSVLLLEKPDKGYIIVTPSTLFNNYEALKDNISLIYEVLMYVYMRSYYLSPQETSWITDNPVDYIAGQLNKYDARHKTINIDKLLQGSGAGMDYVISQINVSNNSVIFGGLTAERNMLFYKIINKTDLPKNEGEISYLTTKQSVVNYLPEDLYMATSKATITHEVSNGDIRVTVQPFHSTEHKINFTKAKTFNLLSKNETYCICTKPSSPEIENVIVMVDKFSYDQAPKEFGHLIATVKAIKKPRIKTYDIRVNGGGLPEKSADNYNMVDIGHVDGRPYRMGSTMIIKLPKALKNHEDKIRFALKQHMAAGVYPVIIFQ